MIATLSAVLLSLGILVYFIATSEGPTRSAYRAPAGLDSPARRNSGYPGSSAGGGSSANRQSPTDESFVASSNARQQGKYDTTSAGKTRPAGNTSPRREERTAPEAGECVLTAKAGSGLTGDIGDCLRPGAKK